VTASDVVTAVVAVLALFLSCLSLYLQRRDKKPHLRLEPSVVHQDFSVIYNGTSHERPGLAIHILNAGERQVHIKAIYLAVGKNTKIEVVCHHPSREASTIEPHRSHECVMAGGELAERLERMGFEGRIRSRIEVRDELGRRYKSQWFWLSIEELTGG